MSRVTAISLAAFSIWMGASLLLDAKSKTNTLVYHQLSKKEKEEDEVLCSNAAYSVEVWGACFLLIAIFLLVFSLFEVSKKKAARALSLFIIPTLFSVSQSTINQVFYWEVTIPVIVAFSIALLSFTLSSAASTPVDKIKSNVRLLDYYNAFSFVFLSALGANFALFSQDAIRGIYVQDICAFMNGTAKQLGSLFLGMGLVNLVSIGSHDMIFRKASSLASGSLFIANALYHVYLLSARSQIFHQQPVIGTITANSVLGIISIALGLFIKDYYKPKNN